LSRPRARSWLPGIQGRWRLQELRAKAGAGLEPALPEVEALARRAQASLGLGLVRAAARLARAGVHVLAAEALTVAVAGDLRLVTLAVVLQATRPLAIAPFVVSETVKFTKL